MRTEGKDRQDGRGFVEAGAQVVELLICNMSYLRVNKIYAAMSKETLFTAADQLPDHFELDDLIDRLLLIEKIEKGREQSRNNQTYTQEEVKQMVKTWFK